MPVPYQLSRRGFLQTAVAAAIHASARGAVAAGGKPPPVIDPHVHIWRTDPRYPWQKEEKDPPKADALPEALLRLMEANGVERTVLVHSIHYRWDCRYVAEVLKAHPGRFMGVCRVNPESDGAPDDLSRWVRDHGFHGVRLSPAANAAGDWINDRPRMDRLLRRAAELQVPLCVFCPTARLPEVTRVLERHHDLDVCIDHLADCPIDRPDELRKLLALARCPRVFVKISHLWSLSRQPYPYLDTHGLVRRVYDAFGPQRLMWGSDWPQAEGRCAYARALALYRDEIHFFTAEDRRWVLGGTARRLWPFA
jgi:predicted TIM-barrel fold metal-dependent hydrolase